MIDARDSYGHPKVVPTLILGSSVIHLAPPSRFLMTGSSNPFYIVELTTLNKAPFQPITLSYSVKEAPPSLALEKANPPTIYY